MKIGAHVSVSGGVEKAVSRQEDIGGDCGQIFAGSPRTWSVASYSDDEAQKFLDARQQKHQSPYTIHSTYLVNLGSPKSGLRDKSVKCLQKELDAAKSLGVEYVVFHPGAHTGAGRKTGLKNVSESIDRLEIPDGVKLLLENTAGKGTTLGKSFESLELMIDQSSKTTQDLGVCLDTCHMHAAGYNFADSPAEVVDEIKDSLDGMVEVVHLNDSKHPAGSEKDEHEHLGEGKIGDEGIKSVLSSFLGDKPLVLETPSDEKGYRWNVQKAKSLLES